METSQIIPLVIIAIIGICLGLQTAVIAAARRGGIEGANSEECTARALYALEIDTRRTRMFVAGSFLCFSTIYDLCFCIGNKFKMRSVG